jgi:hypothetical protein
VAGFKKDSMIGIVFEQKTVHAVEAGHGDLSPGRVIEENGGPVKGRELLKNEIVIKSHDCPLGFANGRLLQIYVYYKRLHHSPNRNENICL